MNDNTHKPPLDSEQNDDPFLRYFDAEMRYLRAAGREFARAQPQGARRLGLRPARR
jgi:type VI secretion system protein ImpG